MIVSVWTLKRGIIDPPEPLEESDRIEKLWDSQDHPIKEKEESLWRKRCNYLPESYLSVIDYSE